MNLDLERGAQGMNGVKLGMVSWWDNLNGVSARPRWHGPIGIELVMKLTTIDSKSMDLNSKVINKCKTIIFF